jgi:hypothetical protein
MLIWPFLHIEPSLNKGYLTTDTVPINKNEIKLPSVREIVSLIIVNNSNASTLIFEHFQDEI